MLVFAPDHEAGDVLQEDQRHAPLAAQLDEVGALERRLREQDAVIGDDADRVAVEPGEAGDQRRAVARLELLQHRAVDDARDHLAHLERLARVGRDQAVQLARVVERRARLAHVELDPLVLVQVGDDPARQRQRVRVVLGQMVGHARDPGVHVAAAQILGRDHLAGRGLHQRRPAQEDRPLLLDDDRLVRHRRHVGATRRAGAHDHRDLRDALGRHGGLVVEDAAEIVPVGKDLVLVRQVGAAGIDQIDAGQPVDPRHVLRTQMLLHRQRIVGAALHRGVVDHDHAFAARDPADAGDHPGRRHLAAIHAVRRELAQLQERRPGVEQSLQPLARQQLAARGVLGTSRRITAQRRARDLRPQIGDHRLHLRGVRAKGIAARVQAGLKNAHWPSVPPLISPTALPARRPMLHSSSTAREEEWRSTSSLRRPTASRASSRRSPARASPRR